MAPTSEDDRINPWKPYMKDGEFPQWIEKPARYIREKFVYPFRQKEANVYYHKRYERVPSIDECEIGDPLCRYEAQVQFIRDMRVDNTILKILRTRLSECSFYWKEDAVMKCQDEKNLFYENQKNYYVRYGEIGYQKDVLAYYMKQKHRMIWLRRRKENGEADADYSD